MRTNMVDRTRPAEQGSERASRVQAWVEAHGDALYGFARRRLPTANEAEDAVQQAFAAALDSLDSLHAESNERAWLFGILRHKVLDILRAARRETPTDFLEEAAGENARSFEQGLWRYRPAKWSGRPEDLLARDELRTILFEAIEGLPPRNRAAFCLRELDGLSSDQVCEVLGVTPTNLWTLIHRAKLQLRRILSDKWFGEGPEG